jgi:hypothetical protein
VDEGLTTPGWPRPIVNGHPVPWVVDPADFGQTERERHLACVEQGLCQVCGLTHRGGDWAYLLVKEEPVGDITAEDAQPMLALAMDDAVMHERCFRLAVGACPALRAARQIDQDGKTLLAYRVRASYVDAYDLDDYDDPRLAVPLAACEPVALP